MVWKRLEENAKTLLREEMMNTTKGMEWWSLEDQRKLLAAVEKVDVSLVDAGCDAMDHEVDGSRKVNDERNNKLCMKDGNLVTPAARKNITA